MPADLTLGPEEIFTPQPREPEPAGQVALSNTEYLRLLLQEVVPKDGQDTDTLFLDTHIVEFLNRSQEMMSVAAHIGWTVKAGALAVMVDRNDGVSQKKLSQASTNAQKIAEMWEKQADRDMRALGTAVRAAGMLFRPYSQNPLDLYNQLWDVSHIDTAYLPWNVVAY
jgi:hypothetical protein